MACVIGFSHSDWAASSRAAGVSVSPVQVGDGPARRGSGRSRGRQHAAVQSVLRAAVSPAGAAIAAGAAAGRSPRRSPAIRRPTSAPPRPPGLGDPLGIKADGSTGIAESSAGRRSTAGAVWMSTLQQRTGDPAEVPRRRTTAATASAGRRPGRAGTVGGMTTARGRYSVVPRARPPDAPGLQRLAQACKSRSPSPRLVEKQDAAVGQRQRAGPARPDPPPTIAARLALGAGLENGGRRTSRPSGGSTPAWLQSVTSSRVVVDAGRIEGRRSPSIVLPAPGGPNRAMWCPPRGHSRPQRPSPGRHVARSGPWPRGRRAGGGSSSRPRRGRTRPCCAASPPADFDTGNDGRLTGVRQRTTARVSPRVPRQRHRQHPADRGAPCRRGGPARRGPAPRSRGERQLPAPASSAQASACRSRCRTSARVAGSRFDGDRRWARTVRS